MRASILHLETLEARQLLSADAISSGYALPQSISRLLTPAEVALIPSGYTTNIASLAPQGSSGPAVSAPFSPAQIRHAYGIDQLSEDGTGQTIAIVDAYDDPTIATDLAAFDTQFGLPTANFTKVTPQGTPATASGNNAGWYTEISLDVEWAHAIAPGAKIILVETLSATDASLLGGVSTAVAMGANQVSMSWGGGEDTNESSDDTYFEHSGVTFFASAGDSASQVLFPAVSPYVTSVGGTTLALNSSSNITSETVWSSSGGGPSTVVAEPSYQAGFYNSNFRGTPDVSYDADPNSGVYVDQNGSYYEVGGTSIGAPQWAGLAALANQGLVAAGKATLGTGQTYGTNSVLYQLAGGTSYTNPNGDFSDITSGSNGHPATTGYDLATGLGSPVANLLIPSLIGPATTSVPTIGDFGFESVPVSAGGIAYNPNGSAWTFSGSPGNGSGVTTNNSGFTGGNPAAPQGNQVAFLQGMSTITQSVAGWAAGSYTLSFDVAQRANGGGVQDFQVLVDGKVVGTFKTSSTAYVVDTTSSFTVTAGTHAVEFLALDSAGGDNTALIDAVTVAVAAAPAPPAPTVPTIGDFGFESVPVSAGGIAYNPNGSAWTFSGSPGNGSGVTTNNSGFTGGNPAAPQGNQVAFLQGMSTITQSVAGWAAGSYTLSFDVAQRANGGGVQDFQVLVDGKVVGTFKTSSTAYVVDTTSSFTVTAGTHAVEFLALDSAGGDNTALIDAVTVAVAAAPAPPAPTVPTIGDFGFESVPVSAGGIAYNPNGSAWTFSGSPGNGSGVTTNNSGFTGGNPAAPQGNQVAFLQGMSTITQSVAGWAAGSYTLSFDVAQRANGGGVQDFQVLVDGKVVGTFKTSSTAYVVDTTSSFTVTAGTHAVEFLALDSAGGDNTALIDAVTVAVASA